MASITKINLNGEEIGSVDVPEALAEYPSNAALVHACVLAHLAARRQGTASAKTKSEVNKTGSKPFPQKGTGRARGGRMASPLRTGGAVAFGPRPRSYRQKIDRASRRAAFFSVLADRVREGTLRIVDSWDMDAPRTKALAGMQKNLGQAKLLCIGGGDTLNACLSARNIPDMTFLPVGSIGLYDLVCHRGVVISADAWAQLEERFATVTSKHTGSAR
jgi:large subunit ribosomal protein L4